MSLGGSKAKPWKLPHCLGSEPAVLKVDALQGLTSRLCSADCVTLNWATPGSDPSLPFAVPPGPWDEALCSEFPRGQLSHPVLGHLTSQHGLKCPTSG